MEARCAFKGAACGGWRPHEITARGIARTFQSLRIFTNMTVLENVMVGQHARGHAGALGRDAPPAGFSAAKRSASASGPCRRLSLFEDRLSGFRLDQLAYSLSYANRRRLEIARALATEPQAAAPRRAGGGDGPS